MAGLSIVDIRQMESHELLEKLESTREELFKLRLNWYAGSLKDPNQMRVLRKDIARVLTVLRERQIAMEIVEGEENE